MKTQSKHKKFQRALKYHGARNIYSKEGLVFGTMHDHGPLHAVSNQSGRFAGVMAAALAIATMGRSIGVKK